MVLMTEQLTFTEDLPGAGPGAQFFMCIGSVNPPKKHMRQV